MKELEQHINPKVEQAIVQEVKKEIGHVASMQPHPGQSVFKLDGFGYMPLLRTIILNKKCTDAQKVFAILSLDRISPCTYDDYEYTSVELSGKRSKKLNMRRDHIYVTALNKKNSVGKFLKLLNQMFT